MPRAGADETKCSVRVGTTTSSATSSCEPPSDGPDHLDGGSGADDLTGAGDSDTGNGGAGADTLCDVEQPVNCP